MVLFFSLTGSLLSILLRREHVPGHLPGLGWQNAHMVAMAPSWEGHFPHGVKNSLQREDTLASGPAGWELELRAT